VPKTKKPPRWRFSYKRGHQCL